MRKPDGSHWLSSFWIAWLFCVGQCGQLAWGDDATSRAGQQEVEAVKAADDPADPNDEDDGFSFLSAEGDNLADPDSHSDRLQVSPVRFQPQPFLQPQVVEVPQPLLPASAQELSLVFSASRDDILTRLSSVRRSRASAPSSDVVLGLQSEVLASTDAGSLLGKSNAVLGVAVERRTPIVTDTLVRGRRVGQQAASGSFWFPARQDLDTMLSKIDSRIISDIIVTKGPYSALYGPGLAFYDVNLLPAPRYAGGYESHASTSFDVNSNGGQLYGRQNIWGGSSNWGYRVGYGHRTGSDYRTGAGFELPSSYQSRDWDVALGRDLPDDQHLEFSYLRLDQTDVEFPGQVYDMDFLVTNAFDLRYERGNPALCDRAVLEGWYNRTRFDGNAQGAGKRRQLPFLDLFNIVSFTDADAMSTGYRYAAVWGDPDCATLTAGTDLRFLGQELNEWTSISGVPQPNTPIPRSHTTNPGLFVEAAVPFTERLTFRSGGRLDWVSMNSDPTTSGLIELLGGQLDQDFTLYSGYLTAEYALCRHWTLTGGAGYGMRHPTMTEMYADMPFVAVFPQFALTSVLGNPDLDPERLWQIDVGLRAQHSRLRGGINFYHAWITDYITYDLIDPVSVVFNAVNTPLATLIGGEAYGEYDLNACWTTFATISHVQGKDRRRTTVGPFRDFLIPGTPRSFDPVAEEPLPVIPPLESRVGIRRHQPSPNPRWAVEFSARIVDDQDRIAASLREQPTPGFTTFALRGYWQATDGLLLVGGVENLTDKFYQEHFDPHVFSQVFQPGVSIYTGLEWTY